MANIGHADLLIVPKFDGLTNAVNKALGSVDMSSGGAKGGKTFADGFKGSLISGGAVMGAVSSFTTKAIDAIASHMSDAVTRLDTLKNYPMVMESLGVSANEANASIDTMSDRLSTLPTTLNSMVSSVQGIYAATKDYGVTLGTATEAGLAMNDMLLAGGQGLQVTGAAMEQFRQMLSKGKPDMQDWKSLISAAPGQVDQLAKSMLGASARANDLYYALGGGKDSDDHLEGIEFASVSMSELLDGIIRLDNEGGAGLASFREQAEQASGGIETSLANMENAITRGLADTMDAIGRDRIVSVINTVKDGINGAFSVVKEVAPPLMDAMSGIVSTLASAGPSLIGLAAGLGAIAKIGPMLSAAGIFSIGDAFAGISMGAESLKGKLTSLVTSINPVAVGMAAVAGTAAYFAGEFMKVRMEEEKAAKATTTFNEAVSRSAALDEYAAGIDGIGTAASAARISMSEFYDKLQSRADAMQRNNEAAEETIASLNQIQGVIDEYAGKAAEGVEATDLSAEAQGRLAWALKQLNDEYGITMSAEDVLNGTYVDQEGNIQNVKSAIDDLCDARREEARTAALTANLTEAYGAQMDAIKQVQDTTDTYTEHYKSAVDEWTNDTDGHIRSLYATADAYAEYKTQQDGTAQAMDDANKALNDATNSVKMYESELGNAGSAASSLKNTLVMMTDEAGNNLVSAFAKSGVNIDEFSMKLADAGYSTESLNAIGAANFAALASACNGNVDAMISALSILDGTNISEKEFTVTDNGTIMFEKGELTDLDIQHIEEKGFEVTDNGTALVVKGNIDQVISSANAVPAQVSTTITATDNASGILGGVINMLNNIREGASAAIKTVFGATGGFYDMHASGGFITNGPMSIGTDRYGVNHIVGEAGREWVQMHADGTASVVPIENRKYLEPYASTIASMIGDSDGGDTYNVNIYAQSSDADAIAKAFTREVEQHKRLRGGRSARVRTVHA